MRSERDLGKDRISFAKGLFCEIKSDRFGGDFQPGVVFSFQKGVPQGHDRQSFGAVEGGLARFVEAENVADQAMEIVGFQGLVLVLFSFYAPTGGEGQGRRVGQSGLLAVFAIHLEHDLISLIVRHHQFVARAEESDGVFCLMDDIFLRRAAATGEKQVLHVLAILQLFRIAQGRGGEEEI